jgi:hypothetical protein
MMMMMMMIRCANNSEVITGDKTLFFEQATQIFINRFCYIILRYLQLQKQLAVASQIS